MTNKSLLQKALSFHNLTNNQWDLLDQHIEKVTDRDLKLVFQTLIENQSRLEVSSMISEYYIDMYQQPLTNTTSEITL